MAEAVIGDFISNLGIDMYQIDPATRIQEYATVMIILKKNRKGMNEESIRKELETNFPNLKIDPLKDILTDLKVAKQINEEKRIYSLTGPGYTHADYIAVTSKIVIGEEIHFDLTTHRFWERIREYMRT